MAVYNNPIVLQRADPWVLKVDGEYYFTGSDPESGPASIYIWAPELHRINGAWYIYFAGAATDFEASGLPTHRMFVLENTDDDPTSDNWVEKGRIVTPVDSFSLDATTAVIGGVQYLVWAQKDPEIEGNSNLYIARMSNPWTLGIRLGMRRFPRQRGAGLPVSWEQDLSHLLRFRHRRSVCRGSVDRGARGRSAR